MDDEAEVGDTVAVIVALNEEIAVPGVLVT